MIQILYKPVTTFLTIFFFLFFDSVTLYAQPGTLDPGFGDNGVFTGLNYGRCYGSTLESNGKLIMVGQALNEAFDGFTVARVTLDGHPDESFGVNGRVINDFGFEVQVAFDAIVQPDGRIVVVGVNYEDDNTRNNFLVARYLTDGKLDSSFAGKGWTSTNFNGDDYARSVAIQPDGKIVVAGSNTYRALVARYNTDGSLDESFGSSGLVITRVNSFPIINAMALQADGKIVLAGTLSSNSNGSVVICRYLSNGSPDNLFGNNGILISDWVQGYGEICNDMILQSDGKILVTGSLVIIGFSYEKQAIVRYNNNGSFDNSFGENGIAYLTKESQALRSQNISLAANGKIVTNGRYSLLGVFSSFYVSRLLENGLPDLSFGDNGFISTNIVGQLWGLSVTADDKIISTGFFTSESSPGEPNFLAIQYNGGESSLPITYKNFTATQKNGFIQLNWQTSSEINNSYFAVERSNTGTTFNELARIGSSSNGGTANYTYTDKLAQDGDNYYRLKQVDKDGKSSYSKTISIQLTKNGNIKIQPNPAKDKLTVSGLIAGENNMLIITDIPGNILKKINTATSQQEINVQQLLPGSYFLSIKNNKGNFVLKFVKQ